MEYVLWVGLILLLVYEIWAIRTDVKGDTISEIVWKISVRPIVPFTFGVLMGHFFW